MTPKPPPAKPSEMVPGTSKVAIRDDSYWENLNKRRMPSCYMQAIMAIESPSFIPCIAIHSEEKKGREKRWFTCLTRDAMTRPCDTPITLLSPDVELLDSIQITTISSFSAAEVAKITQNFPTVLASSSRNNESKSTKMYVSLIYSTMNRIIELWELETLSFGMTMVLIPQGTPNVMSPNDEIFWSAGRHIGSAWFVENVLDWAKLVDENSVTEFGHKMAGMSCEEWESMVCVFLESRLIGDAWRFLK